MSPDIVLVMESSKQVLMLEIPVQWANERRQAKYATLVEECCRRPSEPPAEMAVD